MIKRTAEKSYVSRRINGNKWLLLCCSACAAVVDIVIIALLFIGGTGGEYLACPFVLLALDLIYMPVSLFFTNFRFKYSLLVWISYVVLFTVGVSIGIAIIFGGEGTVLTNAAVGLWAFVHIFTIICAIICALNASRILKNAAFTFAVAAIFVISCAVYVGYAFTEGFFGQGFGNRIIVYALNDGGDSYRADSILYGNGDTVEIPYMFNGKPVTQVGLNIFANDGVKKIILHDDVEFIYTDALGSDVFKDKIIEADKKIVNSVRNKLYAYGGNSEITDSAVNLANSVIPNELSEDEGYVAFKYDAQAYEVYAGKIIPVYVGRLDEFDFASYTADYDYITHREDGSVSNYDWAYGHGGYIVSEVSGGGGSLTDGKVTQSTVAQIIFEKVFRVKVESGNDLKYDLHEKQPELCFDQLDGSTIEYKYMTVKTAQGFTDGLKTRKGFSYQWYYKSGADGKAFTDLPEVLENLNGNDVTLRTEWKLNAPKVTANVSSLNITYGENVSFTSSAEAEAEGVTLKYGWKLNGETQDRWTDSAFTLTRPKPAEYGGSYNLTVVTDGGDVTSLSSSASAVVFLNIERKNISFDWTVPEDRIYDGTDKTVTVAFDRNQLVENETLNFNITSGQDKQFTAKNADTYLLNLAIGGYPADFNECYKIDNQSYLFTIEKRSAQVNWENTKFTYNAAVQSPRASATGAPADGELVITVSASGKNAGSHTAVASTANANYKLTNASVTYTIDKKPLKIKPKDIVATYGFTLPSTAEIDESQCEGFAGNDGVSSLTGTAKVTYYGVNYGTYDEGIKISGLSSANYDIEYIPAKLTILRRKAVLTWSDTSNLVYNGKPQNVTATIDKVGNDDVSVLVFVGNATDVGEHVAQAIGLTGAAADNYDMEYTENKSLKYKIKKASITITAQNKTSVYGEELVPLTAEVTGTIYNNEIAYSLVKQVWYNDIYAEYYYINVQVADGPKNDNYTISTHSGEYTVTKRVAYVKWLTESQRTFTYDGNEHSVFVNDPVAYVGFLEKDLPYVHVNDYSATDAGEYTAYVSLYGEIARKYQLTAQECKWEIKKASTFVNIYLNSNVQTLQEFKTQTGNTVSWKFYSETGSEIYPVNWATVRTTVNEGDAAVVITDGKYLFSQAGVYTITINYGDDNHAEGVKTLTVTVSGSDVSYGV